MSVTQGLHSNKTYPPQVARGFYFCAPVRRVDANFFHCEEIMPFTDVIQKFVLEAIKEFNESGRDQFLSKYSFSKAKTYFLIYEGCRYDCKPILFAAYQHQFGKPLLQRATGGVNNSVRPHLEELGFVVIGKNETLEDVTADLDSRVLESKNRSQIERLNRLKIAPKKPEVLQVTTYVFVRNADVIEERLYLANGVCDTDPKHATFTSAKDGTPYLEVHHIRQLADGGEDTVENTIALCPNCHREKHFGVKKIIHGRLG